MSDQNEVPQELRLLLKGIWEQGSARSTDLVHHPTHPRSFPPAHNGTYRVEWSPLDIAGYGVGPLLSTATIRLIGLSHAPQPR